MSKKLGFEHEMVIVKWDDHWGVSGYVEMKDLGRLLNSDLHYSAGWIVEESRERIVLASELNTTDEMDKVINVTSILRSCIVKITYLEEAEDEESTIIIPLDKEIE